MRAFAVLWLTCALSASAGNTELDADQKAVLGVVQKLFDAMSAHDGEAARALTVAEGRVMAVRGAGKTSNISLAEFAAKLSQAKQQYLERMWNPKILLSGG